MTRRIVRALCSAILLALVLVSLALPVRQSVADRNGGGGGMDPKVQLADSTNPHI